MEKKYLKLLESLQSIHNSYCIFESGLYTYATLSLSIVNQHLAINKNYPDQASDISMLTDWLIQEEFNKLPKSSSGSLYTALFDIDNLNSQFDFSDEEYDYIQSQLDSIL